MANSDELITSVGKNSNDTAALVWSVADDLVGAYKPHEYGLVMQNIQKTDCNNFTKTRVVPGFCFAKIFPLYKYQANTRGKEKNKNCQKYN